MADLTVAAFSLPERPNWPGHFLTRSTQRWALAHSQEGGVVVVALGGVPGSVWDIWLDTEGGGIRLLAF